MGGAKTFQARDIGFKPCLLHQPLVTTSNRLGHRELVGSTLVQVFQPADRGIAGECGGDEPALRSFCCHIVASSEPCVA